MSKEDFIGSMNGAAECESHIRRKTSILFTSDLYFTVMKGYIWNEDSASTGVKCQTEKNTDNARYLGSNHKTFLEESSDEGHEYWLYVASMTNSKVSCTLERDRKFLLAIRDFKCD